MLTAAPEAEGGEAAGEVLGLAASRVGKQLYLPSALLAQHLPAGFGWVVGRVQRLLYSCGVSHTYKDIIT